jgi:hypothetical protein
LVEADVAWRPFSQGRNKFPTGSTNDSPRVPVLLHIRIFGGVFYIQNDLLFLHYRVPYCRVLHLKSLIPYHNNLNAKRRESQKKLAKLSNCREWSLMHAAMSTSSSWCSILYHRLPPCLLGNLLADKLGLIALALHLVWSQRRHYKL